MSTSVPATPAAGLFQRPKVRDTAVLLALAWAVPFALHLVPWSGERAIGVYLVPMFWTAFVAVYFYGLRVGLVVALFAPAVNLAITGLPALERLSLVSFELTLFTLIAWLGVRRVPAWWVVAPLAWVVARIGYTLLQVLLGSARHADAGYFLESVVRTLPGLAVLLAINFVLARFYAKSGPGDRGNSVAK